MQPAARRRKRRPPPLHQWLCILVAALGLGLTVWLGLRLVEPDKPPAGSSSSSAPAPSSQPVPAPGEGAFTFAINRALTGRLTGEGVAVEELHFENPAANAVALRLELASELDGALLFSSDPVSPGGALETALLPALEAGDFPLTAYVTALDAETGQQLGSAEQSVTLKVEPGEGV